MTPARLIECKRDGKAHTEAEIRFMTEGITSGAVKPYQATAWLMAIWFRGMSDDETAWLTQAMIDSGDLVDLSSIPGIKVDKHSTGGVGDTTTLVLAPIAAAAGARVAKMSGRGLGHTGGTLDKMESIPGLQVDLRAEQFLDQVRRIGIAVISQTKKLVPADGILYSLRDVTATIDSIPLIASSVMSKKIACGADAIMLDVKFGDGAFMPTLDQARQLARSMVDIGERLGRRVKAALSDMEQPLGTHIGNALEVREAIRILRGELGGSDLARVAFRLAAQLLVMAGLQPDEQRAMARVQELVSCGQAADKLKQLIGAQGGDARVVDDLDILPQAPIQVAFPAPASGFLTRLRARGVGVAAMALGAGRASKEDLIDPSVGMVLQARVGDPVQRGEPLAVLHAADEGKLAQAQELLAQAVEIGDKRPEVSPLIREFVG